MNIGGRRAPPALGLFFALAAVVGLSAASAPPVAAEPQTTITFGSGGSTGIEVSSEDQANQITVNFAPSPGPLPEKFVIQVPAGYGLDLTAEPGTAVGDGSLSVLGAELPSFASGYGDFVAQDPAAYASDPAAQACAPGLHGAVWTLSTALVGRKVDVTVFVDAVADPGVGYTLQSCPTGLNDGTVQSAASITFSGVELTSPSAAGRYVWRTLVTPRGGATYELQAVAPRPASVTLRGRYDVKRKTAILTGRLVEGGRPAARRPVFISGRAGNSGFGRQTLTNANGTFSLRARIGRTTEFSAVVAPDEGPCEGTTSAPGGCLGSISVPPDGARTTVWVRVRGEPLRAIRAADQRLAERENFAGSDFPPDFEHESFDSNSCEAKNEADLTIRGESRSVFVRLVEEPQSAVAALGLTRVYATRKQATAAFAREAVLATARCEFGDLPPRTKIRPLRLGGLPARARAFRIEFSDDDVSGHSDVVFLQRGRSVARLRFAMFNAPSTLERGAIARVASRMR